MIFREATAADAVAIAYLHAESWRSAYPGIFIPKTFSTSTLPPPYAVSV